MLVNPQRWKGEERVCEKRASSFLEFAVRDVHAI